MLAKQMPVGLYREVSGSNPLELPGRFVTVCVTSAGSTGSNTDGQ